MMASRNERSPFIATCICVMKGKSKNGVVRRFSAFACSESFWLSEWIFLVISIFRSLERVITLLTFPFCTIALCRY